MSVLRSFRLISSIPPGVHFTLLSLFGCDLRKIRVISLLNNHKILAYLVKKRTTQVANPKLPGAFFQFFIYFLLKIYCEFFN